MISFLSFLQLMVYGLTGPIPRVMLNVDQDSKTEHELAPTHPPQVVELTARDLTLKRLIATTDHA